MQILIPKEVLISSYVYANVKDWLVCTNGEGRGMQKNLPLCPKSGLTYLHGMTPNP